MSPELYARAKELDDVMPDGICPGCGQKIDGWQNYEAHYPPTIRPFHPPSWWENRTLPWPWADLKLSVGLGRISPCRWTLDYLSARAHRRRLIQEYETGIIAPW